MEYPYNQPPNAPPGSRPMVPPGTMPMVPPPPPGAPPLPMMGMPPPPPRTLLSPLTNNLAPGPIPSLQPLLSKPASTSPAQYLLKHKPKPRLDGVKKVYVGRLPRGVKDEFIERILKTCGRVVGWKRVTDANGEPRTFGICEFEDPESLLRCWRLLNNMNLLGSQLVIKIDLKSEDFMEEWREYKKAEWIEKQRRKGVEIDLDDFFNRERSGEIMEWEQEIIGDKDAIFAKIGEIIKNKDIIEEISVKTENYITSLARSTDYSVTEHPREKDREKRRKFREEERKKQFEKILAEWREKEKAREKEKEREKEREIENQRKKQELIQKDLEYDPVVEKKKRKKDPEYYKRLQEERKKYREREREDDELERKKEEEAKRLEELRRLQEEEEMRKRKEWEERNAFTQIEVSASSEAPQNAHSTTTVITQGETVVQGGEKFPETEQVDEDTGAQKQPAELPVLDESIRQAINKIEEEVKIKSQEEEEQRTKAQRILENIDKDENIRKQVELAKQLYERIPTRKSELFKYPLNWEVIEKNDIIEKKLRPWVVKRIKDYLGTEEEGVINLIVKKVKKKAPPQEIEDKMETVLEDEAEDFVMKMWKILVFEQLKVEHGVTGK